MDEDAIQAYRAEHIRGLQARLEALYNGLESLRTAGHPVNAVEPQGAIYLSGQFDLVGRTTSEGQTLRTNDDVRQWLLRTAGLAVVPFDAFGAVGETGWCRLSAGAVSLADIEGALPRLRAGLELLK
jgi:aspartate aminotransferase